MIALLDLIMVSESEAGRWSGSALRVRSPPLYAIYRRRSAHRAMTMQISLTPTTGDSIIGIYREQNTYFDFLVVMLVWFCGADAGN